MQCVPCISTLPSCHITPPPRKVVDNQRLNVLIRQCGDVLMEELAATPVSSYYHINKSTNNTNRLPIFVIARRYDEAICHSINRLFCCARNEGWDETANSVVDGHPPLSITNYPLSKILTTLNITE